MNSSRVAAQRLTSLPLAPRLRWALAATLALTVLALAIPPPAAAPTRQARYGDVGAARTGQPPSIQTASGPGPEAAELLRRLAQSSPRLREPADRDPFDLALRGSSAVTPATPAPRPIAMATALPEPQAVAAPSAVSTFRVAGWLMDGDGQLRWLLSDGRHELLAEPGLALPDGHVVQATGADGVQLRHPTRSTVQTLTPPSGSLPPPALSPVR